MAEARQHILDSLSEAMRTVTEPDGIMPVALRVLGKGLAVSRCHYATMSADGELCIIPHEYVESGPSMIGQYHLAAFGEALASSVRKGLTFTVRNVRSSPELADGASSFLALGIEAFVCCALVRNGVLRALMAVHQTAPRDWTAGEISTVEEVVERCWATIEQREAEAKLRRSEALLRIAGRAAHLGGWSIQLPELRITWSDETCTILGFPAGYTPSLETALELYLPEFRELISTEVRRCIEQGVPFDLEAQLVTLDARRIWARIVGHAERGASGAVQEVHGAFQDVTDRRRLEDQFRQAQKMDAVGQLAGGIAHDFNNMLSVILGYTTLLLLDLAPDDRARGSILEVRKAGERAAELTRQLLAFSRQQMLQPRVLDLRVVVSGLHTMLLRLLGENITLEFVHDKTLGRVLADPGQLEQVLVNLTVNARDAMPGGGHLTVETHNASLDEEYARQHHGVLPGHYVMLAVTDSGCGMDKALLARIFEPFFTTKEQGKGTGLGLSTVHGIVTQSHGHVVVASEPGVGTSFKVFLPRVDAETVSELPEAPIPDTLSGTETILLVEDEEQVRAVVRLILTRNGYEVLEAQNGGEAFLICEQHKGEIHLLLTDVVMPRMSGRELAERVRALRPQLRVLYMSGYTEDSVVRHGVLAAEIAFLQKPIVPVDLLRKLRESLGAAVRP